MIRLVESDVPSFLFAMGACFPPWFEPVDPKGAPFQIVLLPFMPPTCTLVFTMELSEGRPRGTRMAMAVRARQLRVSFGREGQKRHVLRGLDLEVRRGDLHMIVGANGCGKSTLLKAIAKMVDLEQGQLDVDARSVGFVFQNPDHQVFLPTVSADVAFGLGNRDMDNEQMKAAALLALRKVRMEDFFGAPVDTLSGGQKQRVAIAGVLAQDADLLLLDELTTFLDEGDQFSVLKAIKQVVDENNVTAIWVTHRLEELPHADCVSYIDEGQVVCTGNSKQIMKRIGK